MIIEKMGFRQMKNGEVHVIYIIRRTKVGERGTFPVRFAVWRTPGQSGLFFGTILIKTGKMAGLDATKPENRRLILKFIDDIIVNRKYTAHYRYLGAQEQIGSSFVIERFPEEIIQDTNVPITHVNEFRRLRSILIQELGGHKREIR